MATILFPRKGDRLRASSVFFQAMRVAASGIGVMSGMAPTRASVSSIAVASGTYRNGNTPGSYGGGSLTSIPAATAGMLRFDLIVFDVSDATLKRVAGSEDTPPIISDFLETTIPQPPELASASQILLGVSRVSSSGIEAVAYGHYATDSIANMIMELPSPSPASAAVQFGATTRLLARKTSGAGAGEECTLSEILDFIGSAARGDILYRGASAWLRLAKGTAGYVLSQGANDPAWSSDPIIAALTTRGDLLYRGVSAPERLAKGAAGQALVQGANDPAWVTRTFDVGFTFGDGSAVIVESSAVEYRIPIACKIVAARLRETNDVSGSITFSLAKRTYAGTWGGAIDSWTINNNTKLEETGLNIAVDAGDYLSIWASSITAVKHILCSLTFEAT